MKADLHNHLGKNGKNPGFDETINLAYKHLGSKSAFGICNCNCEIDDNRFENFVTQTNGGYERIWVDNEKSILSVPEKGIYIIGAEEIITKQGHLVVVGIPYGKNIQTNPKKTLSLEDALKKSREEFNGINIAAHPFGKDGCGEYLKGNLNLLNNFDGWEVYNASAELAIPKILPFFANPNSTEFYDLYINNIYPIGACSFTDGHSAKVIGRSYTNLNIKEISVDSLRNAIKENKPSDNLHMEPAKLDALKHAYNMAMHKAFGNGA